MQEPARRMGSGTSASRSRQALDWLGAVALLTCASTALVAQQGPLVASLTHQGAFSAGNSYTSSISADGRLMAFASSASDLVPGDDNSFSDVFVRDRLMQTLLCISRNPAGQTGNGGSGAPAISADGRFVAFASEASDLVPGDTNGFSDIFVYDTRTGLIERASVNDAGRQADLPCYQPALSGDGRLVAFESYSKGLDPFTNPGVSEIFVRDRAAGVTFIASRPIHGSVANGSSGSAHLSRDGRRVAYESWADNLAPGDLHFGVDVYVTDLATGKTVLVSKPPQGGATQGSSYGGVLSADGNLVAFDSGAKNLVADDTNNAGDVFVADLLAGTIERVSLSSAGDQGNTHSGSPSLSGDGRFVVFSSYAATLVPGDGNGSSDIFVHDRLSRQTVRLSTSSLGVEGNGLSAVPMLALDAGHVIFESWATNLVPGDSNGEGDIFVRGLSGLF